jgi:hypothetical protein
MILFVLVGLLIVLGVPVGIVVGIVMLVRRSGVFSGGGNVDTETLPGSGVRVFAYVMLFVGVMGCLFGLSQLLALAAIPLVPNASLLMSASDVRDRASVDLAALIVALPLAIGFWRYVQGRLRIQPLEVQATARRVFFGTVFVATGLTALYGAQSVVHALLMPNSLGQASSIRDLVEGVALLLVYGGTWLLAARLGWSERAPEADDWAHDLAVYIVSAASFGYLFSGVVSLLVQVSNEVLRPGSLLVGNSWGDWTYGITACIVGGAAFWSLQIYDLRRDGERLLRTVYLYLMLAWIVPMTLIAAGSGLSDMLRRVIGGQAPIGGNTLADAAPYIVAGGVAWAYYWTLLRRPDLHRADAGAAIAFPRRPAIAAYVAGGLAVLAVGIVDLLWLGVDELSDGSSLIAGSWHGTLSNAIALIVLGTVLWLPSWSILAEAAEEAPDVERTAATRRRVLSLVAIVTALVAVGAGVGLLYTLWTAVLGAAQGNTLRDVLREVAVVVVDLPIGAYYGLVLRGDMRRQPSAPGRTLRLAVVLRAGGDSVLADVTSGLPIRVEILGRTAESGGGALTNAADLRSRIELLVASGDVRSALVVLGDDGGTLFPYLPAQPAPQQGATSPTSRVRPILPSTE